MPTSRREFLFASAAASTSALWHRNSSALESADVDGLARDRGADQDNVA